MKFIKLTSTFVSFVWWPVFRLARYLAETWDGQQFLEKITVYWRWLRIPFRLIELILTALLSIYAIGVLVGVAGIIFSAKPFNSLYTAIGIWIYMCFGAVVVASLSVIASYCESRDGKSLAAGVSAERKVREVVSKMAQESDSRDFHNLLMVVNAGKSSEFSMELDHLLITEHNVFIIETKYRTGTVIVKPEAPVWEVRGPSGNRTMRNALHQVKNTCKQFERCLGLGLNPIPIVVLASDYEVTVSGNVSNVVTLDDLPAVVAAFDRKYRDREMHSAALCDAVLAKVDNSSSARRRHRERANEAKMRAEAETITSRASV